MCDEKKNYWNILSMDFYDQDLILALLNFSLFVFFTLLLFEFKALFKLKNITEVEDKDLNNQII